MCNSEVRYDTLEQGLCKSILVLYTVETISVSRTVSEITLHYITFFNVAYVTINFNDHDIQHQIIARP